MRDFPSCFGESGVQIADAASSSVSAGRTPQNLITCLYQAQLASHDCVISVTWNRSLMGQGLSIGIDDASNNCICKLDIKPWLFSKKRGSKCLDGGSRKIEFFWDLSAAKFGSGPEPSEGFYVAILFDLEMVLLLGDMRKEAYRKTGANRPMSEAAFVARREHVYGKKVYSTKAQFSQHGRLHDIAIECDTSGIKDPSLELRVDKKMVMQVKRLAWKFRGNQTILVDGMPVEVFWDVHSWLFGSPAGSSVFMFRTCQTVEKAMPWSYSHIFKETQPQGLSFSLVLYVWKSE